MKVGLIQLTSSDDPTLNMLEALNYIKYAAKSGAEFILTPEVTNCVSSSRKHQQRVLFHEADDPTLVAFKKTAKELNIWLLVGSLALLTKDRDGRFANRSFMISPDDEITARYDKIHMFDAEVSAQETYRESAGYRPGDTAVTTNIDGATVGMTICYDLRFPHLYRILAMAGAEIITVPSAFTALTGAAHWLPLLQARAIENGCFILAPAQVGEHSKDPLHSRKSWGHSMAISPWGEVLAEAGDAPGVTMVDLDLSLVSKSRNRIPSLQHDRPIAGPA